MTKQHARRLFRKVLPALRWAMQLQDWEVTAAWGPIDSGMGGFDATVTMTLARCTAMPGYKKALIEFDYGNIADEGQFLRKLVHELAHIIHADMQTYRRCVAEHVSGKAFAALDAIYDDVQERIVWNIEQMLYHGLGLTPERLIQISEEHWRKRGKQLVADARQHRSQKRRRRGPGQRRDR